ncbi:flagellar motor protein MotB [Desulfovibrio sp. OttesenSCG-928-C06]|nr:flagellar motor protein MotB [Desulfovibrio sp. OttesenSCG-928-C06]
MSGSWKVAYSDFVTALMAFFLLMWILAKVPEEKQAAIAGYFASGGQMGTSGNRVGSENLPPPEDSGEPLSRSAENSIEVARFLNTLMREKDLQDKVRVTATEAGVMLRAQSGSMFEENEIELNPEGMIILEVAAQAIKQFKLNLVVRGHADMHEGFSKQDAELEADAAPLSLNQTEAPSPEHSLNGPDDPGVQADEAGQQPRYSKWDISALRAAKATEYLCDIAGVQPGIVVSIFYGDSRPIVPDTNGQPAPENRRVEFFFHRPEFAVNTDGY